MSTNYNLMRRDPSGGSEKYIEHIGKFTSSTFLFNGQNFKTFHDWIVRLTCMGTLEFIQDEYGRELTVIDFKNVLNHAKPYTRTVPSGFPEMDKIEKADFERGVCWLDAGYKFSDREFS